MVSGPAKKAPPHAAPRAAPKRAAAAAPAQDGELIEALLRARFAADELRRLFFVEIGQSLAELSVTERLAEAGLGGALVELDARAATTLPQKRTETVVWPDPAAPVSFDALSADAGRAFELLAVASDEGLAPALEALGRSARLPSFVYCAGAGVAAAQALQGAGYRQIAQGGAGRVLARDAAPAVSGERPKIRSFDVFDTLIARRCIEPQRVFHRLAQEHGAPEFPALRMAAEAAFGLAPYDLEGIYARLVAEHGMDPGLAAQLLAAEVAAELDEVVPIAENLARVRDGDLLISDMYLGEQRIRSLLDKAGLKRKTTLLVSAHGKRSGEIWPKAIEKVFIDEHLGDNHHADVNMPTRFGINATHTGVSAPSMVEKWLLDLGVRDLPQVIREARLSTWHPNPVVRRLQIIQIQLNFPMLVLASLRLNRLAGRLGAGRLLFASRDCDLWLDLYRVLAPNLPNTPQAEYFYTSRRARLAASPDYVRYVRERLAEPAVVVDICGTGWSMANLLDRLALPPQQFFFVHWMKTPPSYLAKWTPTRQDPVDAMVGPERDGVSNVHLEMCNYAEHGSVRDVAYVAGSPVPVFETEAWPAGLVELVQAQRAAFAAAVEVLRARPLQESLALNDDVAAEMTAQLYQLLSRDELIWSVFGEAHMGEDGRFMRSLQPQ
jgi:hypothetical protein